MSDEAVLSEELEKEADAKAKAAAGPDAGLGYCHAFWAAKKRILREEYGIDWKSPAEEYPTIFFD
jgi:hypothetical protein